MALEVGQEVRIIATKERLRSLSIPQRHSGEIGKIKRNDASSIPYLVSFAKDDSWWFPAIDVEAVTESANAPDLVNYPSHYTQGKVECIDALESAVTGLSGKEAGLTWQVIKYMWRWKFKGNPVQDLEKAEFYLNRLMEHVKEAEENVL